MQSEMSVGNSHATYRIQINYSFFLFWRYKFYHFNGVKLTHVIVNLEKSLVFSVVSTHTDYKWGPSFISAVAELVS